MNNKVQSSVVIKSNVMLKSRGVVPPIDNMPNEYFDVRIASALTQEQKVLKEKMLYWAEKIYDENSHSFQDACYKDCQNCGDKNNHCKRPQNKLK